MPHMGRRKFSMGGKLHGRNMLISEYIFVICVAVMGDKEVFRIDNSTDSIEQMGRKQVSSHMQVVKKFFEDLRCCMWPFLCTLRTCMLGHALFPFPSVCRLSVRPPPCLPHPIHVLYARPLG